MVVCGKSGTTYQNPCLMECAGEQRQCPGTGFCTEGGNEYCNSTAYAYNPISRLEVDPPSLFEKDHCVDSNGYTYQDGETFHDEGCMKCYCWCNRKNPSRDCRKGCASAECT